MLANIEYIKYIISAINKSIFSSNGIGTILPYFNGKYKEDGGISAIILGDNFHFTCHTFSYKNTVFIDFFGEDTKKEEVKNIILKVFDTNNYDMGSKDTKGFFGKHIIVRPQVLSFTEAQSKVQLILKEINMTPISEQLINQKDEYHYDILQPIAESHISFHRMDDKLVADAFSCKYFDSDRFLRLLGYPEDYVEVNRGLQFQRRR